MILYWYRDPDLGLIEITERIRLNTTRVGIYAEEGSCWTGTIIIDDPDGDFEPVGHRILAMEETEAEDPHNRFFWVGYIGEVVAIRGPYRTGASRQWRCTISDLNTILSRRVLVGSDNDRPAESDNARIAWVEATSEGHLIDDTRYLTSDNPVAMDANDYTTQEVIQVYNDCAQQSGKNWYVTFFGDVGYWNDPWGFFSLWYDFATSDEYHSSGFLTNDLADVDLTATFTIDPEAELEIDPMRIYEKVIVPYANTYVTASRTATAAQYAKRDKTMPAENVKTKAKALARANRYVEDARTPEHRAKVKTYVPRSKVNLFREGMMVGLKVTHWPEPYASSYTDMRILRREIAEVSVDGDDSIAYEITLELSRAVPADGSSGGSAYGILRLSQGPNDNVVYWQAPGDTPPAGYAVEPTSAFLEPLLDGSPPNGGWPYYGWKVTGTGTVDVTLFTTATGVLIDNIDYTITAAICLNGTIVASQVKLASGFLKGWAEDFEVSVSTLAVAPDDEITATIECNPPTMPFFRTPVGTGAAGERLQITGGSLS